MWIDCDDELPPLGERVYVYGRYTPGGIPSPLAYRRADSTAPLGWRWESAEWRGTVGVTAWWRPEAEPEPARGTPGASMDGRTER